MAECGAVQSLGGWPDYEVFCELEAGHEGPHRFVFTWEEPEPAEPVEDSHPWFSRFWARELLGAATAQSVLAARINRSWAALPLGSEILIPKLNSLTGVSRSGDADPTGAELPG